MELLELTKNFHLSIQGQIKIVLDRMGKEERIKILEWVSPVQCGKHHKRVEEARSSGTCEWLLQHEKSQSVNLHQKTTLVLNALDEYEPNTRKKIIGMIESLLAKSRRPLKVLISSRPDRDIRSQFLDKPNLEIQATHNQEDIRKYVNTEIVNHGHWKDMRVDLQEEIVTVLLEKIQGMFQWVVLQIKQLLRLETKDAILDRLGKLPIDLKAAYDEIYEGTKSRHGRDRVLAVNAFKRIRKRIPLSCLKVTEHQLLHLYSNLLVIDSQRKVWRFSHLSVAECFEENHWSRPKAHSYAAKVCLKLLIEEYKDVGYPDDPINYSYYDEEYDEEPDEESDEEYDVLNLGQPLQVYARDYWIFHTQAQEGEVADPSLTQLLKSFLGSPEKSSLSYRGWFLRVYKMEYKFVPGKLLGEGPPHAATYGHAGIAKLLISKGADVDTQVEDEFFRSNNALVSAAAKGHLEIVEFLVQERAEVDMVFNNYNSTALNSAAGNGHSEIVELLVKAGADANMQLQYGTCGSALAAAAPCGKPDVADVLIKVGANVNLVIERTFPYRFAGLPARPFSTKEISSPMGI
ncbi:hypothetical protein F5Y09DRAFT_356571 [Xylaria sp. FL1042]|nr:hypothetical protein F5Y09DRAFT_356571 [Xylaria sp. FL1042]